MTRNIDALVKRYENLTGYEDTTTDYFNGASSFYLLPNGKFLNCLADCGCRCDDHRIIFGATKLEANDWDKLHRNYKLVRLVVECNIALVKKYQRLTEEQKIALEELKTYGWEVERY